MITADVVALGRDPAHHGGYDVVTARAFGDPIWTLSCAVPFLNDAGVVIVSEPPAVGEAERWPTDAVHALGLRGSNQQYPQVRRFERTHGIVSRETLGE